MAKYDLIFDVDGVIADTEVANAVGLLKMCLMALRQLRRQGLNVSQ